MPLPSIDPNAGFKSAGARPSLARQLLPNLIQSQITQQNQNRQNEFNIQNQARQAEYTKQNQARQQGYMLERLKATAESKNKNDRQGDIDKQSWELIANTLPKYKANPARYKAAWKSFTTNPGTKALLEASSLTPAFIETYHPDIALNTPEEELSRLREIELQKIKVAGNPEIMNLQLQTDILKHGAGKPLRDAKAKEQLGRDVDREVGKKARGLAEQEAAAVEHMRNNPEHIILNVGTLTKPELVGVSEDTAALLESTAALFSSSGKVVQRYDLNKQNVQLDEDESASGIWTKDQFIQNYTERFGKAPNKAIIGKQQGVIWQ